MAQPDELITKEQISRFLTAKLDIPGESKGSAQTIDTWLPMVRQAFNAGEAAFVPELSYPSAGKEFSIVMHAFIGLYKWLYQIGAENKDLPFPSKYFARKVFRDVFRYLNPEHADGHYVRALLQASADILELGNLDKDPPERVQALKSR